ncbi:hypothetical protein HT031_003831 [Scenedesmus sp. PABB004]|nr:hypothetical protein HT031_003831 [Scenedesmus sp. PABB004]
MADGWAGVPAGLLQAVAAPLPLCDVLAARLACSHWRAALAPRVPALRVHIAPGAANGGGAAPGTGPPGAALAAGLAALPGVASVQLVLTARTRAADLAGALAAVGAQPRVREVEVWEVAPVHLPPEPRCYAGCLDLAALPHVTALSIRSPLTWSLQELWERVAAMAAGGAAPALRSLSVHAVSARGAARVCSLGGLTLPPGLRHVATPLPGQHDAHGAVVCTLAQAHGSYVQSLAAALPGLEALHLAGGYEGSVEALAGLRRLTELRVCVGGLLRCAERRVRRVARGASAAAAAGAGAGSAARGVLPPSPQRALAPAGGVVPHCSAPRARPAPAAAPQPDGHGRLPPPGEARVARLRRRAGWTGRPGAPVQSAAAQEPRGGASQLRHLTASLAQSVQAPPRSASQLRSLHVLNLPRAPELLAQVAAAGSQLTSLSLNCGGPSAFSAPPPVGGGVARPPLPVQSALSGLGALRSLELLAPDGRPAGLLLPQLVALWEATPHLSRLRLQGVALGPAAAAGWRERARRPGRHAASGRGLAAGLRQLGAEAGDAAGCPAALLSGLERLVLSNCMIGSEQPCQLDTAADAPAVKLAPVGDLLRLLGAPGRLRELQLLGVPLLEGDLQALTARHGPHLRQLHVRAARAGLAEAHVAAAAAGGLAALAAAGAAGVLRALRDLALDFGPLAARAGASAQAAADAAATGIEALRLCGALTGLQSLALALNLAACPLATAGGLGGATGGALCRCAGPWRVAELQQLRALEVLVRPPPLAALCADTSGGRCGACGGGVGLAAVRALLKQGLAELLPLCEVSYQEVGSELPS